jgi:hypothetical protein
MHRPLWKPNISADAGWKQDLRADGHLHYLIEVKARLKPHIGPSLLLRADMRYPLELL